MSKTNDKEKTVSSVGKRVSLARMRAGQRGKIVWVSGGCGIVSKLDALGIRKGKEIAKISEQWMKGPVLVQLGNSQIALGFGMALKVLVEITGTGR